VATGRSRDYRKIALSVALILGALGALIGGVFATFTASVSAGPQAITSGTVKLAVGPANDVATGATSIAAGDTISREADLNSTGGTIANKEITL
jgi:predicted ribosomally synthesized peptide with SipW-like signal peptide